MTLPGNSPQLPLPESHDPQLREAQRILTNWHRRARSNQITAYNASKWFKFWHFMIGLPLIIVTAVTGTAEYRSEASAHHTFYGVSTDLVAICIPIAVALQTFLSWGHHGEKLHEAGAKYSSIRRKIEQGAAFEMTSINTANSFMSDVRQTLDTLAVDAPDPPPIVASWTRFVWRKKQPSHLFGQSQS